MKKLTVLLAAVMAFAFSASAYATNFSDISEQPVNVQDSIAKTVALGIINGYEDGTFGPEQNITRAEFAKIAVTAAGAKDTADMLANNTSSFKDVKAAQWYTGWVNASESLGIFQGDGNGNFRPNDTITNQEVITVLMRLLGYNDNLTGTWPVNYVTQANKIGILDDVAVVAAQAAKRADVVVMLDETLDSEIVTYDKGTNEFVQKQKTIGGILEDPTTLIEDSFDGAFLEVNSTYGVTGSTAVDDAFDAVSQIRDAEKQTLNWTVGSDTLIIDQDTRVSYNGGSLFDLAGHEGKVYYVEESNKKYVRFIEVESYTKTTTKAATDITLELKSGVPSKVKVGTTTYNAAKTLDTTLFTSGKLDTTVAGDKNTNFILYFNDDDQVYDIKADSKNTERSYFVKSINANNMKLAGIKPQVTVSLSNDILVYTEDGFISADELKAGDAVQKVSSDLYIKIASETATLSKTTDDGKSQANSVKANIGGSNYVYVDSSVSKLDKDLENDTTDIDDIWGTEVTYVLNKDNSVAAMILTETGSSTKLYGIVLGGNGNNGGFGNNAAASSVTIFTTEGKAVDYDLDLDTAITFGGVGETKDITAGMLVSYKLNKDGEIKSFDKNYDVKLNGSFDDSGKVEIDDNKYIGTTEEVLTNDAVIFEVDYDDGDIEVSIVTKSSFLSEDEITPQDRTDSGKTLSAYFNAFYKNANKQEIAVLAYTEASGKSYSYGVADGAAFKNNDHDNGGIAFVGDEETYDVTFKNSLALENVTDKDLVIYKKSGDTVDVYQVIADGSSLKSNTIEVTAFASDRITGKTAFAATDLSGSDVPGDGSNGYSSTKVKVDEDTVVYVLNGDGEYELGTVEDNIYVGAQIQVVIVDEDGMADLIIADEYNAY